MIKVMIGNSVREFNRRRIDAQWVNEQINGRKHDGVSVCVRVSIRARDISLSFATSGCGGGVGRIRQFTSAENDVIDLWKKHGLDQDDFTGGDLIAFLRKVEN